MAGQTKYRPSLTSEQIAWLISAASREAATNHTALSILGVLAPFKAKIDMAAISPAYKTAGKQSVEEQLGMITPAAFAAYRLGSATYQTKEAYWEACYKLYQQSPEVCTVAEIQAANEHRYLHGLMTDEEIAAHEEMQFLLGD